MEPFGFMRVAEMKTNSFTLTQHFRTVPAIVNQI
jgi:hypothetical protein